MKYLKKIWLKFKKFFTKKPPSIKKIIAEEQAIVVQFNIKREEIYKQIEEIDNVEKREELIKQIARKETAEAIIDYAKAVITKGKKKGSKKLYELHELRNELFLLEQKRTILEFTKSQIQNAIKPDTFELDKRINNLSALLNKNKRTEKIKLSDISTSVFDKDFVQLEELLTDKSTLNRFATREQEKKEQREIFKRRLQEELSQLESLISQNKLEKAKLLISSLERSIKPDYQKGSERLSKARAELKEKELQILKQKQEEFLKKQAENAEIVRIAQIKIEEEKRIAREQAEALRKKKEAEKAERERKFEALLSKKANWRDFQRVLQQNKITKFYHFTDKLNIKSIKNSNGLYSWHYADSNGITIASPGGDSLSRDLDTRYGLQDYVRVSFCSRHPMQYRLEKNGKVLQLLEIDIEVAYFENTIFCDINATDSNHTKGKNIEDLERINFPATKRAFLSRDDPDFKYHQAEVLVKTWIPLKYIMNINSVVE